MTDPTETREALAWLEAVAGWVPPEGYEDAYPRALATALALARLGAEAQEREAKRPPDHYLCWCGTVVSPGALKGATLYETHGERHKCPGPPETVEVDE